MLLVDRGFTREAEVLLVNAVPDLSGKPLEWKCHVVCHRECSSLHGVVDGKIRFGSVVSDQFLSEGKGVVCLPMAVVAGR